MRIYLVPIMAIIVFTAMVHAENRGDSVAIEQTVRNYIEAWYQGDVEKMEEVLHVDLVKRQIQMGSGLRQIKASEMIAWTKAGYGRAFWAENMDIRITVLEYCDNIASAKVVTKDYHEYLHLVEIAGKWLVINTLYKKL